MPNLTNCLKKIGFSKAESKVIKDAVLETVGDGYGAKEAALLVINEHLDEAVEDKRDIENQASGLHDENGPIFNGKNFVLAPVAAIPTDTDFEPGGMAELGILGHAAHVTDGATTYLFAIMQGQEKAGQLVADVLNGQIVAIHDIAVYSQRQGLGAEVVATIAANTDGSVRVIEVLEQSEEFWRKVGIGELDPYRNGQYDWEGASQYLQQRADTRTGDGVPAIEGGPGAAGIDVQELGPEEIAALEAQGLTLYQGVPRETWYFSQLAKVFKDAKQASMPGSQWTAWLKANSAKLGVKQDEIQWTGLTDYLELRSGEKVTKQEIVDYLNSNGVQVTETMLGENGRSPDDSIFKTRWYDILQSANLYADKEPMGQRWGIVDEEAGEIYGDSSDIPNITINDIQLPPEGWDEVGVVMQHYDISGDNMGMSDFAMLDSIRNQLIDKEAELHDIGEIDHWMKWATERKESLRRAMNVAREALDYLNEEDETITKFEGYKVPGGENYRELLLMLPERQAVVERALPKGYRLENIDSGRNWVLVRPDGSGITLNYLRTSAPEWAARDEAMRILEQNGTITKKAQPQFQSSHWSGHQNVLAHVRFDTRESDGKRVLFINEFQSDWGQQGREKGFKQPWSEEQIAGLRVDNPDPVPPENLKAHSMWSESDYFYFRDKGYTDDDVLEFWERDKAAGKPPSGDPDYMRQRKQNGDWIVVDNDGNVVATPPKYLNATPEIALEVVRKGAREGTLGQLGKVSPAPFVTDTKAWTALVMKRMMRYAAENGYDTIAWATGEQNVDAYESSLRQAVDYIEWTKTVGGVQLVGYKGGEKRIPQGVSLDDMLRDQGMAWSHVSDLPESAKPDGGWPAPWQVTFRDGSSVYYDYMGDATELIKSEWMKDHGLESTPRRKVVDTTEKEDMLSDAIGKAMAEQIISSPDQSGTISGENIKISDTGMAGYYDNIVPQVAKDLLKKVGGGKLVEVTIDTTMDATTALPIFTPIEENSPEAFALEGAEDFDNGDMPLIATVTMNIDGKNMRMTAVVDKNGLQMIDENGDINVAFFASALSDAWGESAQRAKEILEPLWYDPQSQFWSMPQVITGEAESFEPVGEKATSKQTGFEITPEMRAKILEGLPLFQPGARASINFQRGIGIDAAIINIGKAADLSSFIHEAGHFFLEVYMDVAARPEASAKIKAEVDTLLNWFGVPNIDTWHNMTLDEKRAHHEKFARGFEQYAFEGKSPRLDMVETFRTFGSWLKRVYKAIKEFMKTNPDVKLAEDVRQVMDRMLATEEQIAAAEAARSYAPLFQTQEESGMTDAEWAEYQNTDKDASATATEELAARSLRDMKWITNAKQKALAQAKKSAESLIRDVRREVTREVMAQPIYQAWQYLRQPKAKKQAKVEPAPFTPMSINDQPMRDALEKMAQQAGWAEIGGRNAGVELGVVNFSKWVPRAEWWPGRPGPKPLNETQTVNAVKKALAGEPLKKREQETVDYMIHWLNEEDRQYHDKTAEERAKASDEATAWIREMEDIYGEIPNADELPSGKIDIDIVEQMYTDQESRDIKAKLGTGKYGMLAREGMDPDVIAKLFGFSSGDQMILDLVKTDPPNVEIDRMTDQRVMERYGDINSPQALAEAADRAVHNQARMRMVATELAALNKRLGKPRELAAAAKAAAWEIVNGKKVKDIKPAEFRASQTRAAKNAEKSLRTGGGDMAAQAKRAEILNGYATRMAYEALEEVDKAIEYLTKFDSEGPRKSIDGDYMDQIDDIRQAFDLRKGVSLKAIEKRKSLLEWIQDQEDQGFEPAVDQTLVERAKTKHYKDMTMGELRELVETVKHIEHLGRLKRKLLTIKDAREFREIVLEVSQSIRDNANRTVPQRGTPPDILSGAGQLGRRFAAWHRKFASIAREMDGGKDGGPVWQTLVRTMNESAADEADRKARAAVAIAELFEPIMGEIKKDRLPANIHTRKRIVPGTKLSMSREQRIMAVLNMGNDSSMERLIEGGMEGHARFSETEIQAILNSLTIQEMDFVQGIWDLFETSRPEVAAQEKRLTGREPKWIPATTLVTKNGTYRGGYFPAKYDTELSTRSDSLEAANDLRMAMKGAFRAAATSSTYTKERTKGNPKRPLSLTFNVIAQHVNEVTHRLAWQDWVTDANRIIRAIDEPIREHYGPEILKALSDTVRDVATGDGGQTGPIEKVLNHIRIGSTIVGLGWRLTTAMIQISGLSQSFVRVGAGWVAKGMKQYYTHPLETGEMVREKSMFMKHRQDTFFREVSEVLNTVRAGEKLTAVKASFFSLIAKMQFMVDMPTWLGAYEKAQSDLRLEDAVDQAERDAIDKEAVARADQAVKDSQGGGQLADLSAAQRGGPAQKLFTNFYSYFNTTYQLSVEAYRRTHFKNPSEVGLFAVDMLMLNTVPVLFTMALREALKGECEFDLGCLVEKMGHEQVSYLMGQMILLRDMSDAVNAAMGKEVYRGSGPAGLAFLEDFENLGQQIGQGEADLALFKAANRVGGTLLHYPAGQINSTVDGIVAIENGEVEGIEIIPALIAGAPKQ